MDRRAHVPGLLLCLALSAVQAAPAPPVACATATPLTIEQARGYVAELRASDVQPRHTEHQLQFIGGDDVTRGSAPPSWWFNLVRWVSEAARWLVWLLAAASVAIALVYARRWMQVRAARVQHRSSHYPSHVNDLDIRPASLPHDIASAARALLERGDERGALSLLYRGALSRLVHGHGVAIRDASTEGECMGLAKAALSTADSNYFERLVRAWQTAVYAGRRNGAAAVADLCARFDVHFTAAALPLQPLPAGVRA